MQGMMWFADLAIDCIFMVDVVLNFRTAFVITGLLLSRDFPIIDAGVALMWNAVDHMRVQ